jgi:hypothetical protein
MAVLLTKTGELIEALKQKPMTMTEINATICAGQSKVKSMQYCRDLINRFNAAQRANAPKITSRREIVAGRWHVVYSWGDPQ